MRARRVIDAVPSSPRRPALKRAELANEPLIVEEVDAAAVDERQEGQIDVRSWSSRLAHKSRRVAEMGTVRNLVCGAGLPIML
jgi:hypothetical protein